MTRRTLTLLAILGMLGAALPAAAATFTALGCYHDAEGDVAHPAADLLEVCVNYDERFEDFVVVVDTVAAQAPLTDDGWLNEGTMLLVGFSSDGDDDLDRVLEVTRQEDAMVAEVTGGTEVCEAQDASGGGLLVSRVPRACLDEAPEIRIVATMMYQASPGGTTETDTTPDDGLTPPLPDDRPESPVCANATVDPGAQLTIRRLACGIGGTEAVGQAVATSQFVFDDPTTPAIDPYTADWVVLARDDDFADALTGSTLSFGQGPLLFTYSPTSAPVGHDPGRLADITRAEILRVLPRGKTVYLLGGEAALAPGLTTELESLGYVVQRFAGVGREATARLVAAEVSDIVDAFEISTGFIDTNMVLIANRANWPDAVLAGSVGAFWGMPILLVDANAPVHPETLAALDELRPDYIHVIGGTSVVSNEAGGAIGTHARANGYALGRAGEDLSGPPWGSFCGTSFVCRWGGSTRLETSAATTQLNRDMVMRFGDQPLIPPNPQQYAVAVNLGGAVDSRNFAYVLSAATVSGRFGGAVFIATEDQTLSPTSINALCNTPGSEGFVEQVEELVVPADTDLISDAFTAQIRTLVEGGC